MNNERDHARVASWMRYFACAAVVMLGVATLALWTISAHREQQQTRLARDVRTMSSVQSIAKDIANAVDLGLPLNRLVGVNAFLDERRVANRLTLLRLLDDQHSVIASSREGADSQTLLARDALTEQPIHDASGRIIGFIAAVPLPVSGAGLPIIAVFTMLVAAASAAAFAGEGLAYAWQTGPVLRRRVLTRAVARLAAEDYRYVFSGARPRRWDRRAQAIVRQVRQINERYAQLQRLAQSLLQTQVAASRTDAILAVQKAASEHAHFASDGVIQRHVVAVQAQARWFCVTVGTAVGGLVQLMYLSAARHHIFSAASARIGYTTSRDGTPLLLGPDTSYSRFDTAPWSDWRTVWHPVWQTAGAIDDPFRVLCLYTCLFGGMALAGRQSTWRRFPLRHNASSLARIDGFHGSAPISLPAVWPATICCGFVALLSLSWRAALFDWRIACIYGALGGLASGILLRACSRAMHVARRTSGFENARAPLDDAWLGMCLGLCWFGPLIVEVLFASISPGWIALLLCAFAASAGGTLFARAGANSPWRQAVNLSGRRLPQTHPPRRWREWLRSRLRAPRLSAIAAACLIAAIALSSHSQMAVLPVLPGGTVRMLLKWAALGLGLLCGAAFTRYNGRLRLGISTKRRVAAGVAATGAAVLGALSLMISGLFPAALIGLSEGGVMIGSMGAVIALSAGVWTMLALSGEAPSKHLSTIAVMLLVLCIAMCCISAFVSIVVPFLAPFLAPFLVHGAMQTSTPSGWLWWRPLAAVWPSVLQVSASTYLWWMLWAVLSFAALRRTHDAT